MENNYPIQLVKIRENQDEYFKEGISDGKLPSWVTKEEIIKHIRQLDSDLEDVSKRFKERPTYNQKLPVLLKAKLNERATAKSYRPNVRSVLNQRNKRNVIGIAAYRDILFKIDNEADLQIIRNIINSIEDAGRERTVGVVAIDKISIYKLEVNADLLQGKLLKVQLVDYQNVELNERSERLLKSLEDRLNCTFERITYAEELIIYKVDKLSTEAIQEIATLDNVLSIKPMPYYELFASPVYEQADIEVARPTEGEEYPVIGILDSGVDTSSVHLSPWRLTEEDNVAGLLDPDINTVHGTMVASVAVYGDMLENKPYTGCGPLKYVSCIVNTEKNGIRISEDELVMHIREAVRQHPVVKVWNLSQGSEQEVSDYMYSDFAKALDDIQKENDILICKSAGNSMTSNQRITFGAESVRALTVGSVCNYGTQPKDLQEGALSPFSRIGYGPENTIKPEVVHYGGNTKTGVNVLTGANFLVQQRGTSFSTPRVAALAAHLCHAIKLPFDPTFIKALIIHYADYPQIANLKGVDYEKLYGFGLPANLNRMLHNDEDEITMIWQPNFNAGHDYQIIDFPYPTSLVDESGNLNGIVTVTVVTDPILKASEGNEYCQTDIEVKLGPINNVNHFEVGAVTTPRHYRNEERIESLHNILTRSSYSKKQSVQMSERNLIKEEHKWNPVKKFHVDLSYLTCANMTKIMGRTTWALTMKALTRDAAHFELHKDGLCHSIRATVIITIRDPEKRHFVYNESIRLLNQYNFQHSGIQVRNDLSLFEQ